MTTSHPLRTATIVLHAALAADIVVVPAAPTVSSRVRIRHALIKRGPTIPERHAPAASRMEIGHHARAAQAHTPAIRPNSAAGTCLMASTPVRVRLDPAATPTARVRSRDVPAQVARANPADSATTAHRVAPASTPDQASRVPTIHAHRVIVRVAIVRSSTIHVGIGRKASARAASNIHVAPAEIHRMLVRKVNALTVQMHHAVPVVRVMKDCHATRIENAGDFGYGLEFSMMNRSPSSIAGKRVRCAASSDADKVVVETTSASPHSLTGWPRKSITALSPA